MADASPAYLIIAAVVNGILSSVGVWASIYVYLKFPHPSVVEHAGRFSVSAESIESYIFSYPAFQIVMFVIPTIQALRWQTVLRRNIDFEASQKAKNPNLQRLDSVLLYNFTCAMLVVVEVCLLGLTIYRASVLATNNFQPSNAGAPMGQNITGNVQGGVGGVFGFGFAVGGVSADPQTSALQAAFDGAD